MYIWGIDISDWQNDPEAIPWDVFYEHGCRWVTVKCSMGYGPSDYVDQHVECIRRKAPKMLIGLYHWDDPTATASSQAYFFADKIRTLQPDFWCQDDEQWWANWPKYWAYIRKEIPASEVPRLSGSRIANTYNAVRDEIYKLGYVEMENLVYTARWFTRGYSPELAEAIIGRPQWIADYRACRHFAIADLCLNANASYWKVTWEEFEYLLEMCYRVIEGRDGIDPKWLPYMPDGSWIAPDLIFWQIDSKEWLPGAPGRLDVNIFFANDETILLQYFGIEEPQPEPEPDPDTIEELRQDVDELYDEVNDLRKIVLERGDYLRHTP